MIDIYEADGEEKLIFAFKPYVYAYIEDYSKFFMIKSNGKTKVVKKGDKYE